MEELLVNNCDDREDEVITSRQDHLVINPGDSSGLSSDINEDQMSGSAETGIGRFGATILIVNTALGGGLLNFAHAYHEAGGIVTATLVQLVLIFFVVPSLLILSYCSDFSGTETRTFQDVLHQMWGKCGQRISSACMVLYCFGTSITYMIIIGDQLDQVFASFYGDKFCVHWYLNRNFTTILSCVCIILPLCYPKKIDFLKVASSIGAVAIVYVIFLIVAQYYTGGYTPGEIKTKPDAWTDIFLVVPTLCFAYQCHVSIIPIYSCLKERNVKNLSYSVYVAIFVCFITYTTVASYGYLTFGSNVASDILKSYNSKYLPVLIGDIAVALKIYVSYPVNLFCGREAISDLWVDVARSRSVEQRNESVFLPDERTRRIMIATIWFCASLTIALLLPNIGAVIKLLGSLAALFVFFFPGLCLLKVTIIQEDTLGHHSMKTVLLQIVAGLYLALGAFMFGCVLTQGIIVDFFKEPQLDIPVCIVP